MDGTVAAAKAPLIDFGAAVGSAFRFPRPFAALCLALLLTATTAVWATSSQPALTICDTAPAASLVPLAKARGLPAAERVAAEEVGPAWQRDEVDAAAHCEPHITSMARMQVLTAPGLAVSPFLLLGRDDCVRQHPDAVRRLLRAEGVPRDEAAPVIS